MGGGRGGAQKSPGPERRVTSAGLLAKLSHQIDHFPVRLETPRATDRKEKSSGRLLSLSFFDFLGNELFLMFHCPCGE